MYITKGGKKRQKKEKHAVLSIASGVAARHSQSQGYFLQAKRTFQEARNALLPIFRALKDYNIISAGTISLN